MSARAIDYAKETWPHMNSQPWTGGAGDAMSEKIAALSEVHGEDEVIADIRAYAAKSKARPTADEFAHFVAGRHPSVFRGRVEKHERYCDDDTMSMITPQLRALDAETKRMLLRLSGAGNLGGVCEWLARDYGLLTVVRMCRRGLALERIQDVARAACGRTGDEC